MIFLLNILKIINLFKFIFYIKIYLNFDLKFYIWIYKIVNFKPTLKFVLKLLIHKYLKKI